MTEKMLINGKEFWVTIESHLYKNESDNNIEGFTATYYASDPVENAGGILLVDHATRALIFESPVEALTYTREKLALPAESY